MGDFPVLCFHKTQSNGFLQWMSWFFSFSVIPWTCSMLLASWLRFYWINIIYLTVNDKPRGKNTQDNENMLLLRENQLNYTFPWVFFSPLISLGSSSSDFKGFFCWVLAIVYVKSQGSKSKRLAPVMCTVDTVLGVFKGQGISYQNYWTLWSCLWQRNRVRLLLGVGCGD